MIAMSATVREVVVTVTAIVIMLLVPEGGTTRTAVEMIQRRKREIVLVTVTDAIRITVGGMMRKTETGTGTGIGTGESVAVKWTETDLGRGVEHQRGRDQLHPTTRDEIVRGTGIASENVIMSAMERIDCLHHPGDGRAAIVNACIL
jgi:hypothetical protein